MLRGITVLLLVGLIFKVKCASITETEVYMHVRVIEDVPLNSIEEISKPPNVCTSDECNRASAMIRGSLDESADPCGSFYNFACGNYDKNTVLSEEQAIRMSFVEVQDKVQDQLEKILSENSTSDESKPFTLAKTFYTSCMNEAAIEEKGTKPLADILESYGGWPAVKGESWNEKDFDWGEVNKKISDDGMNDDIIFSFHITTDSKNSSKRVLAIDQATFGISAKFLIKGLNDPNTKAYYDFMFDAAVMIGANRTTAETELLESLNFETELIKIALSTEARRNITHLYNPFTVGQLQLRYPFLNWLQLINDRLHGVETLNMSDVVILIYRNYVRQVQRILLSTPKRTIANYMASRTVLFSAGLLNNASRQLKQKLLAASTGVLKPDPRHIECVKQVSDNLPISVGALYIRKFFSEESKKAATTLVKNIHDEFMNTLEKVSWMDEETRSAAIKKAKTIEYHIGYPDELTDNNKLEEFHKGLELEPNSFFQNVLKTRSFNRDLLVQKLRQPVNKTDWETHSRPSTVNAFYSVLENSIQLPAAILQDRFFSAHWPSYLNFGAIGWFVGHEITHGFDDEGRMFDSNGNLANWWKSDTAAKFASKAQCIIDQYSNYSDPVSHLTVNGVNTQGENIADNGAVKGMYAAYQNFVKKNGADPTLPNLKYTPEQLFWISAAQLWCAVTRPEFDILQYTADVHAPNKYRVIGTFSNMAEFSRDFNCSPTSKMNPTNKCEVW